MSTPDTSEDLDRLLDDDERLIWHAKPEWKPVRLQYFVYAVLFIVFFGMFGIFVVIMFAIVLAGMFGDVVGLLGGFGLAVVGVVFVLLGALKLAERKYEYTEYAVTNERLIQFGGIVGRDFSSIGWDNVQDVEVNVGFVDGFYETGSLRVIAAGSMGSGVTFADVQRPYELLESIEAARRRKRHAAESLPS